jgi:hypothetical protein
VSPSVRTVKSLSESTTPVGASSLRHHVAGSFDDAATGVLETPEHRVADCPVHDRRRQPLDDVHRHDHRGQRACGDRRVEGHTLLRGVRNKAM